MPVHQDKRQWDDGMTTPDRTTHRSVAITLVIPCHLDTRPVTSTTWRPSSLRRLANRSSHIRDYSRTRAVPMDLQLVPGSCTG